MKCDIAEARKNIQKAMQLKLDNPDLAEEYYKRSVTDLDNMNALHDDVVGLIDNYKKTKGEPPATMLTLWKYTHDELVDDITEIKQLQDYYKSL
jgi:hypothetical protein